MKKKNVLIIGSGARVQKTILPALACLSDVFSLMGIYSRRKKQVVIPGKRTPITTMTDMTEIDFRRVDMIIVAIIPAQVLSVLKCLVAYDVHHCTLFLDTPVLPPKDIGGLRLLSRFGHTFVSEDYIGMTSFNTVYDLIQRGSIGKLRYIYLFHSGYNYHALALLKKLTSSSYIRSVRLVRRNEEVFETHVFFPNDVRATILGPRDYSVGRFLVVGEKGSIADYPIHSTLINTLHYIHRNNIYRGIRVTGGVEASVLMENKLYRTLSSQFIDRTTLNCQKIEGFMRLLMSSLKTKPRFAYSSHQAIYDSIISFIVDKTSFFFDFRLPLGSDSMAQRVIRVASALLPV